MTLPSWDFQFTASKGGRLHRYFWCATIWDDSEPTLWWSNQFQRFLPSHECGDMGYSNNSKPIKTFRAFRRFLRRHSYLAGRRVRLVSRYVGHDIEAVPHEDRP